MNETIIGDFKTLDYVKTQNLNDMRYTTVQIFFKLTLFFWPCSNPKLFPFLLMLNCFGVHLAIMITIHICLNNAQTTSGIKGKMKVHF